MTLLSLFGREDYEATEAPQEHVIPIRRYLTVEVDGESYRTGLNDLLAVARELRTIAGGDTATYDETPLEGFWYGDDQAPFDPATPHAWSWLAAVCLPDTLGVELARLVVDYAAPHSADRMVIQTLSEGFSVQTLHIGGYDTVADSMARIEGHLDARHLEASGVHHEIYLTDPFTTSPHDALTIVRQPCRAGCPPRSQPPSLLRAVTVEEPPPPPPLPPPPVARDRPPWTADGTGPERRRRRALLAWEAVPRIGQRTPRSTGAGGGGGREPR